MYQRMNFRGEPILSENKFYSEHSELNKFKNKSKAFQWDFNTGWMNLIELDEFRFKSNLNHHHMRSREL